MVMQWCSDAVCRIVMRPLHTSVWDGTLSLTDNWSQDLTTTFEIWYNGYIHSTGSFGWQYLFFSALNNKTSSQIATEWQWLFLSYRVHNTHTYPPTSILRIYQFEDQAYPTSRPPIEFDLGPKWGKGPAPWALVLFLGSITLFPK